MEEILVLDSEDEVNFNLIARSPSHLSGILSALSTDFSTSKYHKSSARVQHLKLESSYTHLNKGKKLSPTF
ncbi:hypothetical protein AOLI_G00289080 [Acnodon oligacanthus]